MKPFLLLLFCVPLMLSVHKPLEPEPWISLIPHPEEPNIDVLIDGALFTSYIFSDELKKPILWPVVSPGGHAITRYYPLAIKAGERMDHPHHVGVWLNYGNVNGLDFWNNSSSVNPAKADRYGSIRHQSIQQICSGRGQGGLEILAQWNDYKGETLLSEQSSFDALPPLSPPIRCAG